LETLGRSIIEGDVLVRAVIVYGEDDERRAA